MDRHVQNGSPACQASLHAHIIKEAETQKQRSTLPLQPSAKKFLPHPPSTCFMEREETYCAATANAARFISQPNALHRHTQRASSDREICCSWKRDFLQLEKNFFAVGKEICCNWKWNAAKQVTNLTKRDDEISWNCWRIWAKELTSSAETAYKPLHAHPRNKNTRGYQAFCQATSCTFPLASLSALWQEGARKTLQYIIYY